MNFVSNEYTDDELKIIAANIRKKTIEAIYTAGSGHSGGSLSIADILTVLWFKSMNWSVNNDKNDKFILSKGHAVPVLYAVYCEMGLISEEELLGLRSIGSRLQGHPDRTKLKYLDAGTGALGQGLSISIGYALANKLKGLDRKVYCIVGDGELQEGQIWEAAMYAGANLGNELVCIVDNNRLQNETWVKDTLNMHDIEKKWQSFNWNTLVIDGHDISEIRKALHEKRFSKNGPLAIIANTVKGKGVSFMENDNAWHGKVISKESYLQAIEEINNSL